MNDLMPAPSSGAVHWVRKPGYIKGGLHEPVCGIADKLNAFTSVNELQYQFRVTCEHCLYWLWEQEQPAKKMDLRETEARVVSMSFDNRSMSAHDTETAIALGIEKGVKQGLDKIAKDFQDARYSLKGLVSDGVEVALQRGSVKQNLVGIHKIAEDELDAEFDVDESDENQLTLMKQAVREVLKEQESHRPNLAGQINAAVYQMFEQEGFKRRMRKVAKEGAEQALQEQAGAGVGTVVNVNAEVDPESFKEMVTEAARKAIDDDNIENDKEYEDFHLAQGQKALASVVASDQFQDLFKKLVKDAIEEKEEIDRQRHHELNLAMWERALQTWPTFTSISKSMAIEDYGDVIEDFVHYRRLYKTETACYRNTSVDNVVTTLHRNKVTCPRCKQEAGIN